MQTQREPRSLPPRLLAVIALLVLAGCATLAGPRTTEIPQARLQALIAGPFPLENRLLDLVELRVAEPRVAMRPEDDRIVTEFEAELGGRAFGAPHRGTLSIAYSLRFEPDDGTLRLARVRVERLHLNGMPMPLDRQLARVGVQLAEQLLDDRVVHTLSAKDLAAPRNAGYRFGAIHVTPTGLSITWVPATPR